MLSLVVGWTVSFLFSNLFTCHTVTPFVEAFYGNDCIDALSMWYASCATDVILDFLIVGMPIPMVLNLQLPLRQRLAIMAHSARRTLTIPSVCATRLVMYVHVSRQFLDHYKDETCKNPHSCSVALADLKRSYFSCIFLEQYRNISECDRCLSPYLPAYLVTLQGYTDIDKETLLIEFVFAIWIIFRRWAGPRRPPRRRQPAT